MPEERRVEDMERLARVEEQVKGMRGDFGKFQEYMTDTVNTFMQTISTMHRDYMPRSELEKELELRDVVISDLKNRVKEGEDNHKALSKRPSWGAIAIITLIGAAFGSLVLALFELLIKHS